MRPALFNIPTPVATNPGVGRLEELKIGRVTIFKTVKSPKWYMQWNDDGRQYRPSLRTRSKKQAVLLATKKDAELTLGVVSTTQAKATTIAAAVEKYLESQKSRVGAQSMLIYNRNLKQFAAYSHEVGVYRLSKASAEHLEAFEERLRSKGSPKIGVYLRKHDKGERKVRRGPNIARTVRGKMNVVRQMIKWSVKRRLVSDDPAPGFRLPRIVITRPESFTVKELECIIEAAEPPFKDVFNFFRLTGLRNDELCWMMKADVDLELRYIHIRDKKCPYTGKIWKPKHGNERIVPLCKQAQIIAKRALDGSAGPWLFFAPDTVGKRPGQFTKQRLLIALKAVLRAQKISHGTIHTFRHCFCSFLANQNLSPFLIMKFMGHSSLDIVMQYYHAGTDDLLTGMAGIDFRRMLEGDDNKSSEVPGKHGGVALGPKNLNNDGKEV